MSREQWVRLAIQYQSGPKHDTQFKSDVIRLLAEICEQLWLLRYGQKVDTIQRETEPRGCQLKSLTEQELNALDHGQASHTVQCVGAEEIRQLRIKLDEAQTTVRGLARKCDQLERDKEYNAGLADELLRQG